MQSFVGVILGLFTGLLSLLGIHSAPVLSQLPPPIQEQTATSTPNASVNFSATPTAGAAPLTVRFSGSSPAASGYLNYGDGNSVGGCTGSCKGPTSLNYTHTYSIPGTYTATVPDDYGHMIGSVTITVTGVSKPSAPTQTTFTDPGTVTLSVGQTAINNPNNDGVQYNSLTLNRIQNGLAEVVYVLRSVDCGLHCGTPLPMMYSTSTFELVPNQPVCAGWSEDNGEYLELTTLTSGTATLSLSAAPASSDCRATGSSAAFETRRGEVVAVPGMSEYTDNDFGFSFWYPSSSVVESPEVQKSAFYEGGTVTKSLRISGKYGEFEIAEYHSDTSEITLRGVGASPVGIDFTYYFDASSHTWMVKDLSDPPNGSPRTTEPADVSLNTMGGLHILAGEQRFGGDVVIPLSAHNFLIVDTPNSTEYSPRPFAETIVATDPSVATPVSVAEQQATIQAEQQAYAGL